MSAAPSIGSPAARSARNHLIAGLAFLLLVPGGMAVWAAQAVISGAVISPGVVVVESNVKKVQHPTGGVVAEIRAANGATVRAGDLLVSLDETLPRASLQAITSQLDELLVREARLDAERNGAEAIQLPGSLIGREQEPAISRRLAAETAFFVSRRAAIGVRKQQFDERIRQLQQEISGFERQLNASTAESGIIGQEMESVAKLEKQQLVTQARINQLRREEARIAGARGQLEAAIAQAKGRIAEIRIDLLRIEEEFRTNLIQELRDNRARQAELSERKVAAEDQLKRVQITAPQSGIVHELSVHTVGGVINPGETVMLIVPDGDELVIETRVTPNDIDRVMTGGGKAYVKFPALDQQTVPDLLATVRNVSAGPTTDTSTGEPFFIARLSIPKSEFTKLDHRRLVPGMPVDVFIGTGERTVMSYLISPLKDQVERALRER